MINDDWMKPWYNWLRMVNIMINDCYNSREFPLIVGDNGWIVVDNGINMDIPSGKQTVCYWKRP